MVLKVAHAFKRGHHVCTKHLKLVQLVPIHLTHKTVHAFIPSTVHDTGLLHTLYFPHIQKEFLKYLQHSLDQLSRLLTDQQRKPSTSLKLSSSENLSSLLTFAESWLAGLRYAGRPRSRLGKLCSGECCVGRVMVLVCAHGKLKPQPFPGVSVHVTHQTTKFISTICACAIRIRLPTITNKFWCKMRTSNLCYNDLRTAWVNQEWKMRVPYKLCSMYNYSVYDLQYVLAAKYEPHPLRSPYKQWMIHDKVIIYYHQFFLPIHGII